MTPTEARRQFFEMLTLFFNDQSDDAVITLDKLTRDDLYDVIGAAAAVYWGAVAAIAISSNRTPMVVLQEIALSMTAKENARDGKGGSDGPVSS